MRPLRDLNLWSRDEAACQRAQWVECVRVHHARPRVRDVHAVSQQCLAIAVERRATARGPQVFARTPCMVGEPQRPWQPRQHVVEGAIPARDDGIYLELGGKPGIEVLKEAASNAAAVIAIGSCASWGGVPSADPNPTGAVGVDSVISGKPIVNLPGCPPNPYNLLAVVLEYVTMGKLPALDELGRPKFAYDRLIHDNCPRRGHFDAGRFALALGDEGHRKGWCLYKLGCKGPVTHAACSTRHFNELPGVWPIGIGAPCLGCTEKNVVWQLATLETVPIHLATPPETYPPINSGAGEFKVGAAALVGAIAGTVGGAAWVASQRFQSSNEAGVARVAADRAYAEKHGMSGEKKED